ncbi:hypothetical protein [Brachybacterium epidermidis]|uniref:hypothetical protein n=1 Tax=Brachybacterium epidermidis TaxID=2781983 RepID=UPI00398EE9E3
MTTQKLSLSSEQLVAANLIIDANVDFSGEFTKVTDPQAGTVTFTLTVESAQSLDGELPLVQGDGSLTEQTNYSVTLPIGATVDDALKIDPLDPTTLPPGGTLTTDSRLIAAGGGEGAGSFRGVELGVGGSASQAAFSVTEVTRHQDGTFTTASGPGHESGSALWAKAGFLGLAEIEAGAGGTHQTSVVEHARFADTPEGRAQMLATFRTNEYPTETSTHVLERFSDTHSVSSSNQYIKMKLGLEGSLSSDTKAYESVIREHADGHTEGIERVHIESESMPVVERRFATGKEPSFVMEVARDTPNWRHNDPYDRSYFEEMYPVSSAESLEHQHTRLEFSESEVRQMRENEHGEATSSELEYMVHRAWEQHPDDAVKTIYLDYNDLDQPIIPEGSTSHDPDVPGRALVPDQPVGSAR